MLKISYVLNPWCAKTPTTGLRGLAIVELEQAADEDQHEEGDRRRQRVHGASVPERSFRIKARQIRDHAPAFWAEDLEPARLHLCIDSADYQAIQPGGVRPPNPRI